MLTIEDCLALCELTEEEVLAIAEHEHIPVPAAAEVGYYMTRTPEGELGVKSMIRDDLAAAVARGDRMRVLGLKMILRDYILKHPCCEARHREALVPFERRRTA